MLHSGSGGRLLPAPRAMLPCPVIRPVMLQSNFLGRSVLRSRCSVPGFSVVAPLQLGQSVGHRRLLTVEAHGNSKRSLGDTKHGTRRHRTRTSGFRARRLTVGGRKVLTARRKRGRKTLCPANSRTNKKSTASSDRR